MALLFPPRLEARDSLGNAYNGAKLNIYTAGTTTPITLYSTAALDPGSTLTNPVIADSNGRFAAVYAAEGLLVDILCTTSAGATIWSVEDATFVGASSGALLLDFTNSRARISGSGGEVSFEAGPPVGDDTGGTLRMGGYSGTQADTAELDAIASTITGTLSVGGAATIAGSVAITGAGAYFTERGKDMIGVVETEATTVTGVANQDITLTQLPAGVRAWRIDIWDIVPSTTSDLRARLGYGGTVKSGAGDYVWMHSFTLSSAITHNAGNGTTATELQLFYSMYTAGNSLQMEVQTVDSGTGNTIVRGTAEGNAGASGIEYAVFSGRGQGSYGRATVINIYVSTGTVSFKYRVVPMRGFGE